jgi:DnaJ-class molecular chaperone
MVLLRKTAIIPVLIIIIASVWVITSGQGKGRFQYVGSAACAECHGEDAIGNQMKIWLSSPHAKAYAALSSKGAGEIAKKNNISDPENDARCLKCHTTGGGQSALTAKEGVGCEACHGPGSEYYMANVHVDYESRENGYRRAVKNGMYPIRGIKALKLREKLCLSCHVKTRPCYPEEGNLYDYMIPIQTVDNLQKGYVNFRHPLRR